MSISIELNEPRLMEQNHVCETKAGEMIRFQILESTNDEFQDSRDVVCESILRYLPGRRSVWKAQCDNKTILLKVYQTHANQSRDAGVEWRNANALNEAGFEIPRPLFIGRSENGLLAVAFDFIPDGKTVDRALVCGGPEAQEEIFGQLVFLHARQHAAGWFQRDDHLGNYIWSRSKLWLLDASSYERTMAPLPATMRARNMAVLAANIPLPLRPTYDRMFERNYRLPTPGLERKKQAAIRSRVRKFFRKTQRSCSEFECHKQTGTEWRACRDIPADLKFRMLDDPDQFFERAPRLKDGNTCTVVEVRQNRRSYILKRYNKKSLAYRLQHALITPRALQSWSNGHVLRLFGIATPRPVACLIKRSAFMTDDCYLLMEKAEGFSLGIIAKEGVTEKLSQAAREFAARCRELEILRATHGDMKASNFIFDDEGRLQLIDLDSLTFHRSPRAYARKQLKDIARFMRNWKTSPELKKVFKATLNGG